MKSFNEKLDAILSKKKTVLTESEERYGTNSPTQVKPEKGEDVTKGVIDGHGKIDATGPIPTGAVDTLKTTPGVSPTEGPTGHLHTNADLPRKQLGGVDKDNKDPGSRELPPTPKVYGLHEEEDDEKEKEKKDLPPFLKKKKEKEVKEEKEEEKETSNANKRAGYTDKAKGSGEKADRLKEENDNEEGEKTHEKDPGIKEEEDEKESKAEKEKEEKKKKLKEEKKEEEEDEKADKKAVKEATSALFAGDPISEVLKEKTSTIFEATLSNRIKEYRKTLKERNTRKLNERVEEIRQELAEVVNGSLDLVVESWVKENEVPLESAIKSELVESFIGELKQLFEEHYIELPEEKVDVVSEMANRISKLEQKLNEQIETNISLQKEVKKHERSEIFDRVAKGLATTQVEKLRTLAESVEFTTPKKFETALATLRDNVVSSKESPKPKTLAEQTLLDNATDTKTTTLTMVESVKAALHQMAKN